MILEYCYSEIISIFITINYFEILSQYHPNFPLAFLQKLEYTNQ